MRQIRGRTGGGFVAGGCSVRALFVGAGTLLISGLLGLAPAQAQQQTLPFVIAQAQGKGVPKRALPVPPKPTSQDENERASVINNWTIGLAGGLLEGTFVAYAADLGRALDDGDNLRVIPMITYGAVGNVSDLIYLKGVDFAITYADVLDHYKNVLKIPNIEKRVNYVMPMFQGELHIYVRPEINTLEDLRGKKVNFNTVGSAANYTGGIVFDRLGLQVERTYLNNAIALEEMKKGEIAAVIHVVGKPNALFSKINPEPGFKLLPLEFSEKFEDYYVPAELTHADYPNLIPKGQSVSTISVMALLAVFNWSPNVNGDRYRRCVRFIEYLFERFEKLRQPPYQPKWREMNIAGTIPGWTRFPAAQELIDKAHATATSSIDTSLARTQAAKAAPLDPAEQDRLFRQFLEWSKQRR
ncbi:MAG: C4-dicarboxylate ABC transporter [Hyphomicrobium sp.]|nr:C4-dicarboxylate ABC transporter [Hyphomicrobium sp.]MBN9278292.1 C4-dicarboxylate ABC transporter [Hyphomicrobium sp.]